ncbi:MAG TPA: DUF3052 domain-containing protein [Gemmatimonadales bacterium]|nr:DUF3052 domain-containing protein [Gemmatimonadales bacterium]
MAGYSGTPLPRKLGIKENAGVLIINAPDNYRTLVTPLPDGVRFMARVSNTTDLIHGFYTQRAELRKSLSSLRTRIRPDAVVWVSWPKKASKVPTDIVEDTIREIALPMGYVDIKVAAFDEVWSALKLVIRKTLR